MFSDFSRAHAIRVMETLANYPCAKLFLYPVNSHSEGAYDYYQIIKKPMDITSIINNLLNGRYKNFSDWKRDVYLILQNSKTYNGPDSYITILASQLIDHFDREFSSFYSYDSSIWKQEFQRISEKLKIMINEGDHGKFGDAYKKAIEASNRGDKFFQSLSNPTTINVDNQLTNPKIMLNKPLNRFVSSSITSNQSFSKNTSSAVKDDFDSPPEISDESKGGPSHPNSQFHSFELSASKNNIYSNDLKKETSRPSEIHFNSIFEGINIHDLPPQMVLSGDNIRPNISSNTTINNIPKEALYPPSSSMQKQKLPSIFGNMQFESLPPIFGTDLNQNSFSNLFNENEVKRQNESNLEHNIDFQSNAFGVNNTSSRDMNNINNIDSFAKATSDKNTTRYIPQPVLMPVPAIALMQSRPTLQSTVLSNKNAIYTTGNENAINNSSFINGVGRNYGSTGYYGYENNKEKFSNERKEESFDNSGPIDVTDYF